MTATPPGLSWRSIARSVKWAQYMLYQQFRARTTSCPPAAISLPLASRGLPESLMPKMPGAWSAMRSLSVTSTVGSGCDCGATRAARSSWPRSPPAAAWIATLIGAPRPLERSSSCIIRSTSA